MNPTQRGTELIEVNIDKLTGVASNALHKLGLGPSDAQTVLDVLMYGQLRGSSQGLIKIVERTVCPDPDAGQIQQSQHLPAMIHLQANGNLGMVVMSRACDLLTSLASKTGIAAVSTVGTATSTGAIGYYARKLANAGLVGIVMAGSPKTTALHGGVDPLIGTNPVALAMPGKDEPLVIDFASAATTVFDLIAARAADQPIAHGLAYDAAGKATTNPGAALDGGAIKTFGEAKGSALGLMIELLTGALSGASLPSDDADRRGNLLVAIAPSATIGADELRKRVASIIDSIEQSRSVDAKRPIRVPGAGSAALADQAEKTGTTRIDSVLWQQLQALANS